MPDFAAAADALRAAAAALDTSGPGPDPEPGDLTPPVAFTAAYNAATRKVTSRWAAAPDAVSVQRHERMVDPLNTLKATAAAAAGESESSELKGGRYEWALRSVGPDGELSDFTVWVATDVPVKGGDEPDDEDEQDEDPPPSTGGPHPSDVLDLRSWTVMLPTGGQGDPDNLYLIGQSIPGVFFVRDGGVVCRAPADGVHSPNSKYPRTELRQMANDDWTKAAWPSLAGHSLEAELAIDTRGLAARRRINGLQIHDGGDDVCQIMCHETDGLGLMHSDGNAWESIDPNYVDGTRFTCKITAEGDRIQVDYNGARVVDIPKKGSGWYWKAGCYLQTGGASEHHEPAGATGEVVIWRLVTTGGAS